MTREAKSSRVFRLDATLAESLSGSILESELDTSLDPRTIALVGASLAGYLKGLGVEALVCWEGDDQAALAQAVAAEMNIRVYRGVENLGLLTLEPLPERPASAALIASRWTFRRQFQPLLGLASNSGLAAVIAVAVLEGDGPPENWRKPYLVLARP